MSTVCHVRATQAGGMHVLRQSRCSALSLLCCRHAKEQRDLQTAAAAAAATAAAQHSEKLQQALRDAAAASASQDAAHQTRLGALAQQLMCVLQLPQELQPEDVQPVAPQQRSSMRWLAHPPVHPSSAAAARTGSPPPGSAGSYGVHASAAAAALALGCQKAGGPSEPVVLSETLVNALAGSSGQLEAEDAAAALAMLVHSLVSAVSSARRALVELRSQHEMAIGESTAVAADFEACATNLQSLVAMLASSLPLPEDLQSGLNGRDAEVFEQQLSALREASCVK